MKRKSKVKEKPIDGLGPKDIKRIRAAVRQVWHWSYSKKLVIRRSTAPDGFSYCEACNKKCPKVYVDHKSKVGDVDAGFIKRMFIPSRFLQALCKKCHDKKTKAERDEAKHGF